MDTWGANFNVLSYIRHRLFVDNKLGASTNLTHGGVTHTNLMHENSRDIGDTNKQEKEGLQ